MSPIYGASKRVASGPLSRISTKAPRERHNFFRKPGVTGRAAFELPRAGRVPHSSMKKTALTAHGTTSWST
ncbi:hypothetical protein Pecwa_2565 [Pectobacterium parmentieri WPP163]|nr:hypothetical protein Pecwa_2565 [Pectobacterium parmentieri WPP163]